ncbi:hypothetical protein DITRI_Ditri05aG0034700 [Diplodiscus trichospermus]
MEGEEKPPIHLASIAVLTACSHAGLVELGMSLFNLMILREVQDCPEIRASCLSSQSFRQIYMLALRAQECCKFKEYDEEKESEKLSRVLLDRMFRISQKSHVFPLRVTGIPHGLYYDFLKLTLLLVIGYLARDLLLIHALQSSWKDD